MLKNLIHLVPEEQWNTDYNGVPMWKQVYHVVYYIDYWLRLKYDESEFRCVIFDERISPELNIHTDGDLSITRTQMADYLEKIHIKTEQFFQALQDEDLAAPIISGVENYTYLDVITGQIRHIMYNIGYCNALLREQKLPEADWYSYNEKDD
jgi:hypothetical protein